MISSPLISEIAVAMFLGSFGIRATLIYIVSGMVLSMIAGFVLGKMRLESFLSNWVKNAQRESSLQTKEWEMEKTPFLKRLPIITKDSLNG